VFLQTNKFSNPPKQTKALFIPGLAYRGAPQEISLAATAPESYSTLASLYTAFTSSLSFLCTIACPQEGRLLAGFFNSTRLPFTTTSTLTLCLFK